MNKTQMVNWSQDEVIEQWLKLSETLFSFVGNPRNTPAIIERLNFDKKHWLYVTTHFESKLKGLVGSFNSLTKACQKLNYKRTICRQSCETYFP